MKNRLASAVMIVIGGIDFLGVVLIIFFLRYPKGYYFD